MSNAEEKMSAEVAEAEFQRWAAAMRLDLDQTGLSADDIQSLEQNKRRLVKALRSGSLVIDDSGQAVYSPGTAGMKPLTFVKPTVVELLALDEHKHDQPIHKIQNIVAVITRTPRGVISKFDLQDYGDCKAIVGFLLAPGH